MLLRPTLLPCLVLALSVPEAVVRAQTPDSVGFHRGQWGTEFTIGSGFAAAGILRFSTPTRAVLLDVGADYSHSSSTTGSSIIGMSSFTGDDVDLTLRLGTRSYRSIGRNLYRIVTLGASANYQWEAVRQDSTRTTLHVIGGGVFADIGATWLVTPHLGLGARFGAAVGYSHNNLPNSDASRFWVSIGNVALAGQLYF